jgi:hypothetical protein
MFEPDKHGIYAWMRKVALDGGTELYSALVVDVGAFTTDMGCVRFEMRNGEIDDVHHPEVLQVSKPIGIHQLDERVLARLSRSVREAIARRPVRDLEQLKPRLYGGIESAVPNPRGGILTVGGAADLAIVDEEVKAFAREIIGAVVEFCHENLVSPNQVVITGGGAAIERLRRRLMAGIKKRLHVEPPNILDPNEPFGVLLEKPLPQGGWRFDPNEVDERLRLNRELARGGSALGACSVFIDLPKVAQ